MSHSCRLTPGPLLQDAVILGIHSVSVSSPPQNESEEKTGCIIHELQAGRQRSTWQPLRCDEAGETSINSTKACTVWAAPRERGDAAGELRARASEEPRGRASESRPVCSNITTSEVCVCLLYMQKGRPPDRVYRWRVQANPA